MDPLWEQKPVNTLGRSFHAHNPRNQALALRNKLSVATIFLTANSSQPYSSHAGLRGAGLACTRARAPEHLSHTVHHIQAP